MGGVHNIQSEQEWRNVLSQKGVAVVDCFATWCGPCKTLAPELVKMSENVTGATFYKLDVDELSNVAQELGIRAMPTILLFKDGEQVDKVVGANKAGIEAMVEKHV